MGPMITRAFYKSVTRVGNEEVCLLQRGRNDNEGIKTQDPTDREFTRFYTRSKFCTVESQFLCLSKEKETR